MKSFWVLSFLLLVCPEPFVNAQTATFEISGAVGGFSPTLLEPERYMRITFTNTTDFEVSIGLKAFDTHGDLIRGSDILNPATLRVSALDEQGNVRLNPIQVSLGPLKQGSNGA